MNHYDCAICKGACCESLTLGLVPADADMLRWLLLRAKPSVLSPGSYILECKCTALDDNGRCKTYSDRPQICRNLEPGGLECTTILTLRRTPAQILQITAPK